MHLTSDAAPLEELTKAPPELCELVHRMLDKDPSMRPGAIEIRQLARAIALELSTAYESFELIGAERPRLPRAVRRHVAISAPDRTMRCRRSRCARVRHHRDGPDHPQAALDARIGVFAARATRRPDHRSRRAANATRWWARSWRRAAADLSPRAQTWHQRTVDLLLPCGWFCTSRLIAHSHSERHHLTSPRYASRHEGTRVAHVVCVQPARRRSPCTRTDLASAFDNRLDALKESVRNLVDAGGERAGQLRTKAVEVKDSVFETGSAAFTRTTTMIKEHPIIALGIAFGVGYFAVRMLRK